MAVNLEHLAQATAEYGDDLAEVGEDLNEGFEVLDLDRDKALGQACEPCSQRGDGLRQLFEQVPHRSYEAGCVGFQGSKGSFDALGKLSGETLGACTHLPEQSGTPSDDREIRAE